MPTYYGFSTQGLCDPQPYNLPGGTSGLEGNRSQIYRKRGSYALTDQELVLQDFINALNIRQGQKVGQPQYGTTVWDFIFEPNTRDIQQQLSTEIRRVASQDPRIILNEVRAFPKEDGILVELELAFQPFNNAQVVSVFFDRSTNSVLNV